MHNPFIADRDSYRKLAEENAEHYQQAEPFPHIYFDTFLSEDLCEQVLSEFWAPESDGWLKFNDPTGVKLASKGAMRFPPASQFLLNCFNSAAFVEFLELLTGIEGLIPDPWFEGGGLHQIPPGGYLKIHADFNWHPRLRLDRRLNILLYLNKEWHDDYGGHLELWNREMTSCVRSILPIFNRCVIFNTTDWSFHGHPQPLTCPETMTRKSLALYYYSNGRPEEEQSASHSTLYQVTPAERKRMQRWSFRSRDAASQLLENMASIAHKPAGLLRRLSNFVRPRH